MLRSLKELFETYFMVLVHPFRIHYQFRHQIALPGFVGQIFEPLKLSEAVSISWFFAMLRGLFKILILNFFLQSFLEMQSEDYPLLQEIVLSSGLSTYYFLLFSAALDIIFFPIATLVITEFWAWVIRSYSKWLNPEAPHEEIADQITTHALSSNLFQIVPVLGDIIQPMLYLFLIYAGLRTNLGASRSLAMVIISTPTVLLLMLLGGLGFTLFCLLTLA